MGSTILRRMMIYLWVHYCLTGLLLSCILRVDNEGFQDQDYDGGEDEQHLGWGVAGRSQDWLFNDTVMSQGVPRRRFTWDSGIYAFTWRQEENQMSKKEHPEPGLGARENPNISLLVKVCWGCRFVAAGSHVPAVRRSFNQSYTPRCSSVGQGTATHCWRRPATQEAERSVVNGIQCARIPTQTGLTPTTLLKC